MLDELRVVRSLDSQVAGRRVRTNAASALLDLRLIDIQRSAQAFDVIWKERVDAAS